MEAEVNKTKMKHPFRCNGSYLLLLTVAVNPAQGFLLAPPSPSLKVTTGGIFAQKPFLQQPNRRTVIFHPPLPNQISSAKSSALSLLPVTSLVESFTTTTGLWTASSSPSYVLTRIVFLRALGLVYFVAFLVAFQQNQALIGDDGITPARWVLEEARDRASLKREGREAWMENMTMSSSSENGDSQSRKPKKKGLAAKLLRTIQKNKLYQKNREVLWDRADRSGRPITTILWLAKDFAHINPWLNGIAMAGMFLSALVAILGAANVPILLALWICQRSLMAVGQSWYGFGWENQLAELGFHALFLSPLLSMNPISGTPVPRIVRWSMRWFLFRIMMGAGLIKFRSSDKKWKDLTTMYYFYETQPVPSLLTRTMHFMPKLWHRCEVIMNHFVECVAPFLLILPFLPRTLLRFAGLIQMQFQAILISTGNLSFLNWLTMVPAILCLDDACLRRFFSPSRVIEASIVATTTVPSVSRGIVSATFGGLVVFLSVPVVKNLLSKRQQMNAAYDSLRLINTYGAFGVVNEDREEWIIQSAAELTGNGNNDDDWREYQFKVKPGNVHRRPRWISPYHYRLDWQMWIASSGRTLDRSPWLYRFLVKLLQQDKETRQLLEQDPWEVEAKQPKHIRIDCYRYRFHKGNGNDKDGHQAPYWDREFVRRIYPREGTATLESLTDEIQSREPTRSI